jgi:hypothetical protein
MNLNNGYRIGGQQKSGHPMMQGMSLHAWDYEWVLRDGDPARQLYEEW